MEFFKKSKVMVGMSGGVDSSVAALLLRHQGYEVAGVTFRLWDHNSFDTLSGCHSQDDINDARLVCDKIGIPHYVIDFTEIFRNRVIDEFVSSYKRGETPNPCVSCNHYIKFGAFLEKAKSMGFDYIATGHYVSVVYDEIIGKYRLKKASYIPKDQSYVLYNLTQQQLASILTPLGGYTKDEVRRIAEENNLTIHDKAESQDICFVPDGDYAGFMKSYTGHDMPVGDFINLNGDVVGKHRGIGNYTIGQRKGLGISFGKPVFVTKIDAHINSVTLGDDDSLWKTELIARCFNWIELPPINTPVNLDAKIRYSHNASPAVVTILGDDRVKVEFYEPQRAITPGQAVVFYDNEYVIGGGTITG